MSKATFFKVGSSYRRKHTICVCIRPDLPHVRSFEHKTCSEGARKDVHILWTYQISIREKKLESHPMSIFWDWWIFAKLLPKLLQNTPYSPQLKWGNFATFSRVSEHNELETEKYVLWRRKKRCIHTLKVYVFVRKS